MHKTTLILLTSIMISPVFAGSTAYAGQDLGFTDTPMLPGGNWHVSDSRRPMAPVVAPGANFSQGAQAPADATVLFDGKDLSHWVGESDPARWKVENGYMEVVPGTGDIHTTQKFCDFQLHLEWAEPVPPQGDSQARGNSGVLLQGRYEVQVLDTYHNRTYADGACGSIYAQFPPLVNACTPPGNWETYDIIFHAPRFKDGRLVKPANVTVIQNGLVVQDHQKILGDTGYRILGKYQPYSGWGPIELQDHRNPVRYRNIWIRPLHDTRPDVSDQSTTNSQ